MEPSNCSLPSMICSRLMRRFTRARNAAGGKRRYPISHERLKISWKILGRYTISYHVISCKTPHPDRVDGHSATGRRRASERNCVISCSLPNSRNAAAWANGVETSSNDYLLFQFGEQQPLLSVFNCVLNVRCIIQCHESNPISRQIR